MSTAVICIILIGLAAVGGRSYMKRLVSGCCGSSGRRPAKRIKVRDKNSAHYPYHKVLKIDGMVCGNCAVNVENALNHIEGVWARVRLAEGEAEVYMKRDIDSQELKAAVRSVGYLVYQIEMEKHAKTSESGG